MAQNSVLLLCLVHILLDDTVLYRGAGKSLARRTSRCILFNASLVIYIYIVLIFPHL